MSGKGINQHKQIESLKTQVNLLGDQVKELEILLEEAKNLQKNIDRENVTFDLNQSAGQEHVDRESKYLALFNSIPIGIYRSTPAGELVEANQALVEMLGFPDRQTLLATKVTELFVHAEDRLLETKVLSETGDVRRYELPLKRYEGQIIWVEDYARVVMDENHEIMFYEGSMINISERKRVEVEILQAKETAEEASRVKGLFLDNMSHEMRTPLNGILGTLDLLNNDDLSINRKELTEIMQESGRSLLKIVDNILDLDISGSGQMVIKNLPLNLRQLLQREVDKAKPKADEKKLSLTCMIADEIPALLVGDGQRIEQVLENLLENAIKFTHSGYVQLQATVKDKTGKVSEIHIRISDTGIGIASHQLKQIFEPFAQADNSYTRQFGGAGLGTSIARKLVEKMGGQIWAQSPNPDSQSGFPGSIFHVVIPLKNEDATSKKVAKKPGEKIKGLLVEDNVINQKLIARLLNRLGIEVDIVINGLEAVKQVQKNQYDVIFMDIQMPVMNGLEATSRIRKNGFNFPIIAVTAYAIKGYREKCLQAGMDDYVAKPVHFEHLASVIKKFF